MRLWGCGSESLAGRENCSSRHPTTTTAANDNNRKRSERLAALPCTMDFRSMTVQELATRVRERQVSAQEVVEHSLAVIETSNPSVNAFVALDPASSRSQAKRIDTLIAAGTDPGALAGIPIGVKDLEDAAGFVTTNGAAWRREHPVAQADSVLVARLRAAGCIVMGKTNTPEHGWTSETISPAFGATHNPAYPGRSAGGSSGGSAAAVAAGMVPLATGSDGGGSIRIPAALCGLSGFKPSQGRVPAGSPSAAPGSGLLSVKGPMTARIRDVAFVLDAVMGADAMDPFSLPAPANPWYPILAGYVAPPKRIVWSTMGYDVDPGVFATCEAALASIEAMGTEVVFVDTVFADDPVWTFLQLWSVYAQRVYEPLRGTPAWDTVDPGLRDTVQFAVDGVDAPTFASALDACYRYNAEIEICLLENGADLLLTPTVAGDTPLLGHPGTIDAEERLDWVRYTYPCNLTRRPAGTVVAGHTPGGLPVGLQVIGRPLADLDVLRALCCFEDLLGAS